MGHGGQGESMMPPYTRGSVSLGVVWVMTRRAISARPYGVAKLAGVSASDVTVTVADARRRLLAGVKAGGELRTSSTRPKLNRRIKSTCFYEHSP